MPRKTKIIFITVFAVVGMAILGFYYYRSTKSTTDGTGSPSGYNIFNPFGGGTTNPDTNTTDGGEIGDTTNLGENGEQVPEETRLHKLTTFAVAGATYFDDMRLIPEVTTPVAETPVDPKNKKVAPKAPTPKFEVVPSLRYVERVTGHIYQMYLDTKIEGKNSNSTIPSIAEALFDNTAKSVIYRYLSSDTNSISSFIGTLGGTKSEFLPSNIVDISISGDETKFFYITKTASGVVGTIRSFNETKSSRVWSSAFTEWSSQWAGKDKIFLTTKASSRVDGSIFSLNTATGSLSKILGGVKGLTTNVNGSGTKILYSASTSSGSKLGIFNVQNNSTTDLNIYGLAEKCVWGADGINVYCAIPQNLNGGEYPDLWYQGQTSFTDRFLKIDSSTGGSLELADSQNGEGVDAIKLFLDKSESQLFFINNKDSTLWSLDIK